jgi:hypothetical protein
MLAAGTNPRIRIGADTQETQSREKYEAIRLGSYLSSTRLRANSD